MNRCVVLTILLSFYKSSSINVDLCKICIAMCNALCYPNSMEYTKTELEIIKLAIMKYMDSTSDKILKEILSDLLNKTLKMRDGK